MPAVLVHGVPDTHRVWRALVGRLYRDDVITLSLPGFGRGFGREIPSGFGSRFASRTRARFVASPDGSPWWELERPAEVAKELEAFWERA
jgi:pimeloyl-ACP methyl ester carboxylesterase